MNRLFFLLLRKAAMKRLFSVFISSLLLSGATFAQVPPVIWASPTPHWPANGVIPADMEEQYVFLDYEAGQIVLSYPEDLGKPEYDERYPGPRQEKRYDLNNQVGASFLVDVKPNGQSFTYNYQVSNSEQAKDPIRSFSLVTPRFQDNDLIVAAAGWAGAASPSSPVHSAIQHAIGKPSGVFLSWYYASIGSKIMPGAELGGFTTTSALRPGFTLAYVRGTRKVGIGERENTPDVVGKQAAFYGTIEGHTQNVVTIGPRFESDATTLEIVNNFYHGLTHLTEPGFHRPIQLERDSPAVREALRVLAQYLEATQQEGDDLPSAEPFGSLLVFNAEPNPGLEAGILQAMKLSLTD